MAKKDVSVDKTQANVRKSVRGAVKGAKSMSVVGFNITEQNKFPCPVQLANVKVEVRETENDGNKPVLIFHFGDAALERQHFHTEWPILAPSDKNDLPTLIGWQNDMLAHMWDTFMGVGAFENAGLGEVTDEFAEANPLPESLEDEDADRADWYYFFLEVAEQFNTGKAGKPVYRTKEDKPVALRIKLVLDQKNTYYQLPKFGNFLEVYKEGKETLLRMSKKDRYIMPATPTPGAQFAANNSPSSNKEVSNDLPDGF